MEIPGPFRVLARQIWIKAEKRKPPVVTEVIAPQAVQAGSSDPNAPAAHLIDRSGLQDRDNDGLDEHSSDVRQMWLSAKGQTGNWLEFDFGAVRKIGALCLWNYNDPWHTDRGVCKADLSVWTPDTGWRKLLDDLPLDQAEGSDDYDEPTVVKLDAVEAQKVRLDDLAGFADSDCVGLSEVQFFEPPGPQAVHPAPAHEAEGVARSNLTLAWIPGTNAVAHQVYAGTGPDSLKPLGQVEKPEAALSRLAEQTRYYWRVDETQPDGSTVAGKVWSFTTGGLLGWWKLDEAQDTKAADASGHNHAGTLAGDAHWQPSAGRLGGALQFDGDGDFIDLGRDAAFNCTDEVTVAAWIKVGTFDKNWQAIVTKGDSAWRLARELDTDGVQFAVGDPMNSHLVQGRVNVHDDQWHHVAGVYDGRILCLYVDGRLDISAFYSGGIPANDYPVYIGENAQARGRYWNGLIDDVRLYNCALSPEQIQALAAGKTESPTTPSHVAADLRLLSPAAPKKTTSSKLLAWWRFDETDGNQAADSSGNHADGTLVGNPQWQPTGGKVGGALKLGGRGDYVEVGNESLFDITDAMTVAAWVKVERFDKDWQALVTKGNNAWRLHRAGSQGTLAFHGNGIGPDVWGSGVTGTKRIDDNEWHHVVASYDGSTAALYLDGTLDQSVTIPGRIQTNDFPVLIGENAQTSGREWNGWVDEVCVFACALDAATANALYAGKDPVTIAASLPAPPVQTAAEPPAPPPPVPPAPEAQTQGASATEKPTPPATPAVSPAPPEPAAPPEAKKNRNWLAVLGVIAAVGVVAGVSTLGRGK